MNAVLSKKSKWYKVATASYEVVVGEPTREVIGVLRGVHVHAVRPVWWPFWEVVGQG
jgi:hypothetical protein